MHCKRRKLLFLLTITLMTGFVSQRNLYADNPLTGAAIPCVDGMASAYPCNNIDLLAHLPLAALGAGEGAKGNDHWGWSDPLTGKEYVIFGLTDGTVFIDISDRINPIVLGTLPSHEGSSTWRDIKVYQNVAYITADIPTNHGLQLFDLSQLRDVENPPVTFSESGHYDGFGPGHNLWINEESGYLYVFRSDTCNGEIHMIDIRDALDPQFAGCFAVGDAPLSDSECVIYKGPDQDYQGREICFTGSDDNVSIGDVTDKENPQLIADFKYDGIHRAHQGSVTADQAFWLLSDTEDEAEKNHKTRTYVIDVQDLDAPQVLGFHEHETTARDHNVYIVGSKAYETNWKAGLRVLHIGTLPQTQFLQAGYFDIAPDSDSIAASGAWSSYPWWSDGVVTVSGTDEGLFILKPVLPEVHFPVIASE